MSWLECFRYVVLRIDIVFTLIVDRSQDVFNILFLLFIIAVFYAWFGVVMFVDTEEGRQMFPNFIEALWTLWTSITTANYPDVMMPGYNHNRWVALYFVSFMILTFFFLTNVILAMVVNEYDSALDKHRIEHASQANRNLRQAYRLLSAMYRENNTSLSPDKDMIDRRTVMDLFTILNLDFPEFRTIREDDTKLLFGVLDRDGSSKISEEEFMDFGNVLLLEFVNTDDYKSFIERRHPVVFRSRFWQNFCSAVNSGYFESAIDVVLVLNAVVVAIQSYPELSDQVVTLENRYWDGSIDTYWGKQTLGDA